MQIRRFSLWSLMGLAVLAGGAAGYSYSGLEARREEPGAPVPETRIPNSALLAARKTSEDEKAKRLLEEGDPWQFYATGDWRNAAYNFGLARAKVHSAAEGDRIELGRGVAAFKAALAEKERFDAALMDTAMEAFGTVLASRDAGTRENAHYNLANAIFERAKAAEKQRAAAAAKAKTKREKKKYAITLKYLDGLIRQLENSIEHYQETLLLNAGRADAAANHGAAVALVRQLREIRKEKIRLGTGKCDGDCDGDCEGGGGCDGECERPGVKGDGHKSGQGEAEDNAGPDEPDGAYDEKPDKNGNDASNEEFKGTPGATEAPGEAGERGQKETSDDANDELNAAELRRNELIQHLKQLSQELPPRERGKRTIDVRPANDW